MQINIIDDDLLFGSSTPQVQQPNLTQQQNQPQLPSFNNLFYQPFSQQQPIPGQSLFQQTYGNSMNQSYQQRNYQPQQFHQQPQQYNQQPYQQLYQQQSFNNQQSKPQQVSLHLKTPTDD